MTHITVLVVMRVDDVNDDLCHLVTISSIPFKWVKILIAVPVCSILGVLAGNSAAAASPEPVVVQVTFVEPISVSGVGALQYGLLEQSFVNPDVVVIAPDSTVTDTANRVVGGVQAAASLTVTATPDYAITILIDSVVNGTGYALGTFICNYNAGTDTVCGGAGYSETSVASATLLVGASISGDGLAVVGAADGSFNVTVSYQ